MSELYVTIRTCYGFINILRPFFIFLFFFYNLLKTIHNTTKLHTALLLQKRITEITYSTPFYKLGYIIYNTGVNGKGKKN